MRKYQIVGIVPDFIQGTTGSRAAGGLVVHNSALGIDTVGITGLSLVVRTISDATGVVPAVEQIVRDIFPNAARMRVASADQLLQNDLGRERLGASFFAGFGLVSLILGMIGVFGLVAHSAECRAREMGVRLALGAPRYRLVLVLTGNSLRPVVYGTLDGLVAAAILSNAVATHLHGISVLDPVSYTGTALLVLGAAIVASVMAALRIRHLTPEILLRAG
jgi:putative ABC transport system permease protein